MDKKRELHSVSLQPITDDQQLFEWNATQQDYPKDLCLPQLVAQQSMTTPDAMALIANDHTLSYKDVNEQANQLAHYLQKLGVGPGVLVGCCIERSPEMVVGLLGILKAGGAYVPLDPSYPSERLAFMLSDTRIALLVTQQQLRAQLPALDTVQFVLLDSDNVSQQSTQELSSRPSLTDLAYVIYTSGSTGQPKGVCITHENLLNLIFWHQQAFQITSEDRATQIASPAFDATGWEIWPYLTKGASIYVVDNEARVAPELLRDWLVKHAITITFLPTPLAESAIALEWPTSTALRILLTGADRLHHYPPPSLPFTLINNYGPTEATVVATYGPVPPTERADLLPPIGRPIANTQIYILDENLQQVPIGEAGELYIGGAGVAQGYLHRPELTKQRFIVDPFSPNSAARLYKTGDIARFLPDGQIAFMGRSDQQIKIRGYRIEPGEITTLLNDYPGIQTSLVIAREDIPGEKRLVAYIVQEPAAHLSLQDLRTTLMAHLPDYMVPAVFVVLDTISLMASGKIDYAALPAPDMTNTLQDEAVELPSTPTEERIAGIVCSLLNLNEVGIDDNFFMLGGHSLLGTQIIARVADTFSVELSLRALFEAPTIRELSAQIEQLVLARIEAMSDEEALQYLSEQRS